MKKTSTKNIKGSIGTNILVFPQDYRGDQPFYGTVIDKKVSGMLEEYVICRVITPVFSENDYSFTVEKGDLIFLFNDDDIWIIEDEVEILAFVI